MSTNKPVNVMLIIKDPNGHVVISRMHVEGIEDKYEPPVYAERTMGRLAYPPALESVNLLNPTIKSRIGYYPQALGDENRTSRYAKRIWKKFAKLYQRVEDGSL